MTKSLETKNQKPKTYTRCHNRSWEVVLEFPKGGELPEPADVMKYYAQCKYGVYRGFIYPHTEDGQTHYHIGLIFRDVPKDLVWSALHDYFKYRPNSDTNGTHNKLKCKSRSFDKKLQQYHDYCCSEEQHPHQDLGEPYHYKWTPEDRTDDGISLDTCTTKVYVQYHAENGLGFKQIYLKANIKRRADLAADMSKYNTQIRNVKKIMADDVPIQPIETFNPEVVKQVIDNWDPSKQSLVLEGPSNRGKTELAKSILKHITGTPPKMISDLNALAYRDVKQPIVYDDMKFNKISRHRKIHLLDLENDRDVRILYGVHTIEAGTQRIFTTNESELEFFGTTDTAHQRRMCWIDVSKYGKLYI